MSICDDCLKTECQFRNDRATSCANHSVEVFSYRKYIEDENDPEKLMNSFIYGWSSRMDGYSQERIEAKGYEVPKSSFVPSEEFKPCTPQEAYELLKQKIGSKARV